MKIIGLIALVCFVVWMSLPSFARWNKRRISDSTEWSFYMESYDRGEYNFRHDHKLYVTKCGPMPGTQETDGQVQLQCDMLKDDVGRQMVGAIDVTEPSGQLTIKTSSAIALTIETVRQP
jgi:hypothetical protein